jgi:O-antigen/teichoic acid export membrane protein
MITQDPQFLYMILVLPSLFGLTLLGEGLNKLMHEEWSGIISIIFAFMFLGAVVFTYMFFSSYVATHKIG